MTAAFITNIAFPKTLNEVFFYANEIGHFDVEEVLTESSTEWTAPKDSYPGELVFFMHSKTSIDTIRRLRKELRSLQSEIEPTRYGIIAKALDSGESLYKRIGGCIFAKGIVNGNVVVDKSACDSRLHWSSIYYAPISNIEVFDSPVHISRFRDFIFISRAGAITKLDDQQVSKLLSLLES